MKMTGKAALSPDDHIIIQLGAAGDASLGDNNTAAPQVNVVREVRAEHRLFPVAHQIHDGSEVWQIDPRLRLIFSK